MEKSDMSKVIYVLLMILVFMASQAFGQIEVTQFNAGWNNANDVNWFSELGDCEKKSLLIEVDNNQSRYSIAVVPTIVILNDGEEVKRYQADISFTMQATRKEIQEYIDELLMEDF